MNQPLLAQRIHIFLYTQEPVCFASQVGYKLPGSWTFLWFLYHALYEAWHKIWSKYLCWINLKMAQVWRRRGELLGGGVWSLGGEGGGQWPGGCNSALFPTVQCFPGSSSSAPVTQAHLCKEQLSWTTRWCSDVALVCSPGPLSRGSPDSEPFIGLTGTRLQWWAGRRLSGYLSFRSVILPSTGLVVYTMPRNLR